ncbi:uncharacterized protein RCC_09504 [Ramularia collo-cygni]|uniref:Uncharacterized protein n=1 Tax=Ramularia collo-cygni TaxID=112498 RepID=A0A2D3VA28_9PEZI|nr:uncharacterized protein RCC_09504 [Ramularia collo-cygni]CZT23790.1 uncharacterized protein RCC_09504 [Ramularia collo-cygni]
MASYLNPTPDTPIFGVSALKLWLKGDITTPDFLASNNGAYADKGGRDGFGLQELHRALYLAILEISLKLDPELECAATQASGFKYCIAVDVDEFYEGRDSEVRSLVDLEPAKRDVIISTYDRDAVCEVLEQAREEIGWLESQVRRLDVHMENAESMKRIRSRISFVFRPLARTWEVTSIDKDDGILDGDEQGVGGYNGEDEEILEVDETEGEEHQMAGDDAELSEALKKSVRKERLELFKKEVDAGFGTARLEEDLEEGEVQEKTDSPLAGLEEDGEIE